MYKVLRIEVGDDFLTLYFDTQGHANEAGEKLYKYLLRIDSPLLERQRKNFIHKPGDVPHFHAHEEAFSPHFHLIYTHRPTAKEIQEVLKIASHRMVDIQAEGVETREVYIGQ